MYLTDIFNALNVSTITNVIDVYDHPDGSRPALFDDKTVPSDFNGKKSINFYQLGPIDCRLEYGQATYTANCRAETQGEALTIAAAVTDTINRTTYTDYITYCQLEQVLEPMDDTDVYNAPVQITIKKR